MQIISKEQIEAALTFPTLIPALRTGFIDFYQGRAKSAPITNIDFPSVNGEMHIKPGYLLSESHICVKLVTCFYDNPGKGLPTRDGTVVVADRETGQFKAVLCDGGLITDMRTAGASAVAIDALAREKTIELGVVGTGTQAFWHVAAIANVRKIENVKIWGRSARKAEEAAAQISGKLGIKARTGSLEDTIYSDVVVSATPARSPVLTGEAPKPGSVVVAMGADAVGKREVSGEFASKVHRVVADSVKQCRVYGELQWPDLAAHEARELGDVLATGDDCRKHPAEVVLFDSTGLGFQDAVGAQLVLSAMRA
ncbi:MAG TPA: ornithine cyclodeaminase family protein [Pseudolabrys sp.]|nr:ornithine cyclodeaminase family protein [Pseudolabrys sp.]